MATQLAFLEVAHLLQHSVQGAALSGEAARTLARIGLANYFAGALLLPYGAFLRTAEALHYDIERLAGVSKKTVSRVINESQFVKEDTRRAV